MTPATVLAELAKHLRADAPLSLATRDFLAEAVERVLAGEERSVDRALGLSGVPGKRGSLTVERIAARDELLRRVACDYFAETSRNATAAAVHKAWSRYASSAWPRERSSDAIPVARLNRPEFGFWQIMKLQDRVLAERSIRRILATS